MGSMPRRLTSNPSVKRHPSAAPDLYVERLLRDAEIAKAEDFSGRLRLFRIAGSRHPMKPSSPLSA